MLFSAKIMVFKSLMSMDDRMLKNNTEAPKNREKKNTLFHEKIQTLLVYR
jgi:hypothetical protein